MKICELYDVNSKKDAIADILEESDKRLKVVLQGTTITVVLTRNDTRFPYIGFAAGMEFETWGDES